jgi:hypothetical protein
MPALSTWNLDQTRLLTRRELAAVLAQSRGYLLQGLLVCAGCGYGWYGKGITRFTKNDQAPYPYYRCCGMDAFRHSGARVCPHRPIRLDRFDAAVWADVCQLLQNPKALREEFERRIHGDQEPNIDVAQIHKQIKSVQRGISRLIDAWTVCSKRVSSSHAWPALVSASLASNKRPRRRRIMLTSGRNCDSCWGSWRISPLRFSAAWRRPILPNDARSSGAL